MHDFLCRVIPASNSVRGFKILGGFFLASALAFAIAAFLPFGAFAEENDTVVSEEPMMVDSSSEGGGIVPR